MLKKTNYSSYYSLEDKENGPITIWLRLLALCVRVEVILTKFGLFLVQGKTVPLMEHVKFVEVENVYGIVNN